MSINIYHMESYERVTTLAKESWELPEQIAELERWLQEEGKNLIKGPYVADIGFDIRKDALGGGAVMSSKMMKLLSDIGMEIHLSEYPGANNE